MGDEGGETWVSWVYMDQCESAWIDRHRWTWMAGELDALKRKTVIVEHTVLIADQSMSGVLLCPFGINACSQHTCAMECLVWTVLSASDQVIGLWRAA